MKRVTFHNTAMLAISMLLISFNSFAQLQNPSYIWGEGITAGNTGSAYHVAMDKANGINSVVQVGRFTDTLRAGSGNLFENGGMYITYFDTSGNLLWALQEGLNYPPNIFGYSCPSPLDVEMLPNGNVVVLGTLCADSANIVNGNPVAANGYFVASYTGSGVFQWLKTYNVKSTTYRTGTIEASQHNGLPYNQIYVAFTYGDTLEMLTDTLIGYSNNANTAFFALDLAGNEVWTHNIPGELVIPKDILSFYNSHLYLLYDYDGLAPSGLSNRGAAIRKFDLTNGSVISDNKIGLEYNSNLRGFEVDAFDVITSMSRLVVTGRFSGDVILGPDTLHTASGGSEWDIWIAEIDTTDLHQTAQNSFEWARSITSTGQDYAMDVISFGSDVILAGNLGIGGAVLGGDTLVAGSLLVSYNANGVLNWSLQQPPGFQTSIHDIKPHYSFWSDGLFVGGGIMFEALFGADNIVNPAIWNNTVSQVSYLAKVGTSIPCNLQTAIAGSDTLVACQSNQQLVSTVFGGSNNYSINWSPPQYLDNPTSAVPSVVEHVHLQQFVLQVTDNVSGCTVYDTVVVGVYKPQFDTLYLCAGDTVSLDLGAGATIYDWVNLPFAGPTAQIATVDTPGVFWGVATFMTAPVNCGALTSQFTVFDSCLVLPDSVWPGDANADGVADLYDVLNIGIGYNISGLARTNASMVWVGQAAQDWNLAFLNGTNLKHADCDGNGYIDSFDVDVVALNYGLTHAKGGGGSVRRAGSPPLSISFVVDTVQAPVLVTADISLGSDSFPVTDGYGVAFSLLFDQTLVDSSSIQTDFAGSWLGNGGGPQSLTKNLFSQGKLDIAHTRTNQNSISGHGHIATVSFYIQDNIIGKDFAAYNFGLDVAGSLLISDDETVILLDEVSDHVTVLDEYTAIAETSFAQVGIYPNPGTGQYYITGLPAGRELTISVTNLLGQVVAHRVVDGNQNGTLLLDLSHEPNGVYLLKIEEGTALVVKRVVKQ